MKYSKIISILFLSLTFSLITLTSSAQSIKTASYPVGTMKTVQFMVSGNCEKCKKNIEHIVMELCGVKTVEWNIETKIATLTFDLGLISLHKIQKRLAKHGYDNDGYKASKKAYNKLESCCQYVREVNK
jgi:copper chaperone CopZ